MKNKKLIMAVVALTMCASASVAFAACDNTPEHTHSYNWSLTTPPTCTEKGEETGVCVDGDHTTTRPVDSDPTAHKYAETWTVTNPTMTGTGTAVKACVHNDDASHALKVTLPALENKDEYKSVTPVEGKEPTCTEKGEMKYVYEHETGDITFVAEVDALGHTYVWSTVKEATCEEPGLKHGVCACGDEVDEEIAQLPHEYEENGLTLPTLSSAGRVSLKCKDNESHTHSMTLPALINGNLYTVTPKEGGKLATYTYSDGEESFSFDTTYYKDVDLTDVIEKAVEQKVLVGKAESVGTTSWMYEYNADRTYVHVKDNENSVDYYIDIEENGSVSGLRYDYRGLGWIDETEERLADGFNFFLYTMPLISGAEYVGVEGLIDRLNYYASEGTDGLFGYAAKQYENAGGQTENIFTFNRFSSTKALCHTVALEGSVDTVKNFYNYKDTLYTYTVSFTVDENGMVTAFTVTTTSVNYSYDGADYKAFLELHKNDDDNKPTTVSAAEFNSYTDSAAGGFDTNALNEANPIKGYTDGKYYTLQAGETLHQLRGKQTALTAIEEYPENPYDLTDADITSFTFKDGDGSSANEIAADTVLDVDNSSMKFIYVDYGEDSAPYINLNDYSVKIITLGASGNEEVWEEGSWGNITVHGKNVYANMSAHSDGFLQLGFRSKFLEGDFKLVVTVGNATQSLVFRSKFAAPRTIAPLTYVYSDIADAYNEGAEKEVEVYAGQPFYFGVTSRAGSGDDYLTDTAFTASVESGATLSTAPDEYENAKQFVSNTEGTYTISLASVKAPNVKSSIKVTVKAVPSEEEIFAGTHSTGAYKVEFGEDKSVKITDPNGVSEFTYAYDAATKNVTLTKVSGEGSFGLEVTPAYTLRLTYENSVSHETEKVLLVKEPEFLTAEKAVSGTTWVYGNNSQTTYIVFDSDGKTAYATQDPANTTPDGSTVFVFTYVLTPSNNDKYDMAITAGNLNPMQVGWFTNPMMQFDGSASLTFDGSDITSLKVYGNTMKRVMTASDVDKALRGKTFASEDGNRQLTVDADGKMTFYYTEAWYVSFTYTVTADAAVDGKFNLAFVEVEGSASNPMIEYAFLVSVASGASYVQLNGAELEVYLKVGTSASSATLVKMPKWVDTTLEVMDELVGVEFLGMFGSAPTKFTFGANGTVDLSYNGGALTANFTYTLKSQSDRTYAIQLKFVSSSNDMMFGMLLDIDVLNSGSYLTLGNRKNLTLKYSDGNSSVKMVNFTTAPDGYSALDGTTWYYTYEGYDEFNYKLVFTADYVTAYLMDDDVSEEYAYVLTEGDDGKYYFTFTATGSGYWGDCGVNEDESNDGASFVVVEDGKVAQLVVTGLLGGDVVEAEYTDVEPVDESGIKELLNGTVWTYGHGELTTTLTFNDDGTVTVSLTGGAQTVPDETYSYELSEGRGGIVFTFTAVNGAAGNCGLVPEYANNNGMSLIRFDEDDKISGLTIYMAYFDGSEYVTEVADMVLSGNTPVDPDPNPNPDPEPDPEPDPTELEKVNGLLNGTLWNPMDTDTVITFNEDNTLTVSLKEGGATEKYSYTLSLGTSPWGTYWLVSLTALDGAAGALGLNADSKIAVYLDDSGDSLSEIDVDGRGCERVIVSSDDESSVKAMLNGTNWTYSDSFGSYTIAFNNDGTVTASGDVIETFTYKVADKADGSYYLYFEYDGYPEFGCGLSLDEQNGNAYVTVENGVVTQLYWNVMTDWEFYLEPITKV